MPKIRGASLAEHRAHTRTALFAALGQLMRERGFDAVTLADIAQRAGVGRTAVYNHFPDKESMLLGFMGDETDRYIARVRDAVDGIDDPVEQLRAYIREQLLLDRDYHLAPGPALRDVLSAEARHRLRQHVAPVEVMLREILQRALTTGALPPQDLDVTVPLVHSCLTGRTLPRAEPERTAFIDAITDFVLGGIGAPREPAGAPREPAGAPRELAGAPREPAGAPREPAGAPEPAPAPAPAPSSP